MRIGTNHGSLSDRIMSRYGDTPVGMVESAMEFLRIARNENYHNIVLSMKSSNPQVMVQAYRLLVKTMQEEFGESYPLHLGVTEAGDGEDGRIKSAIGIGTLLEEGIGDTVRVSLTEDPELEIPVCKDLVKRYTEKPALHNEHAILDATVQLPYSPFQYKRRESFAVSNIGGNQVPVVIADISKLPTITPADLQAVGYTYNEQSDKWSIADTAADYIFTGHHILNFALPGTLKVIVYPATWLELQSIQTEITEGKYFPIYDDEGYTKAVVCHPQLNFVMFDCFNEAEDGYVLPATERLSVIGNDDKVVLCLSSQNKNAMPAVRAMFVELMNRHIKNPVVLITDSHWQTTDEHLVHYAIETGALLLDGMGDGICLGMTPESYGRLSASYRQVSGRNYQQSQTAEQFINNTAFSILQATRTRISKTEYISCPSCGRTLFDLQETTAKIRAVTNHLKGLKIAIMGCIVNGPGEMADADFGYVGSGPGKITLYKSKEVVKRNVPSEIAVEELINLLKENGAWVEPQAVALQV
jgi:(E)-4-hydroxy-3-methylbut-2-enyl-diphosphate synthase